jgi:hypothetical protein
LATTRDEALLVLNKKLIEASWHRNPSRRVVVVIDAGIGSHSGAGGPVLLPFTRTLLERRGASLIWFVYD